MMVSAFFYFITVGFAEGFLKSSYTNTRLLPSPKLYPLQQLASTISNVEVTSSSKIQKWFILSQGKRAEVFVSDATSKASIIAEAWKSVLVSLRVLESDVNMPSYDCIYEFVNVKVSPSDDLSDYATIAQSVENTMTDLSVLFQPAFSRSIRFLPNPTSGGEGSLIMILETMRTKSMTIQFEEIDYSPDVSEDDMEDFSNDLECFPFPTVMDFVSEINRPVDPFTMSELRFNFKPQDFKYDLVQMAKKKNPQKVVDGINCKLTRLQNWRDILSEDPGNMPDPFSQPAEWSAAVATKFKKFKESAQSDPKGFLNTQYDKRTTFIKIIDLWSDRLKRAFKYIYQSQRPPEDFITPIMQSRWRNEVLNTTRLFALIPFLDLQGPEFQPGSPAPLFHPERQPSWEEDYDTTLAMGEMLVWLQRIERANAFAGGIMSPSYLGPVKQHTYSRGYVTERALHDCWLGLEKWLVTSQGNALTLDKKHAPPLSAQLVIETLQGDGSIPSNDDAASDLPALVTHTPDHTDDFIDVLNSLNAFTRAGSKAEAKSVKEMYRGWFKEGRELGDWWTTTVRNLDLVQEMSEKAEGRRALWSEIITDMVEDELARDVGVGAEDKSGEDCDLIAEKWVKYKPLMESGELLESLLPWRGVEDRLITPEGLSSVEKMVPGSREQTMHVDFTADVPSSGFLFVCPRLFRGQGLSMEVSAFCEFAECLSKDLKLYGSMLGVKAGKRIEVVALHPLMVTSRGLPDFSRRAPHPALLFRVSE